MSGNVLRLRKSESDTGKRAAVDEVETLREENRRLRRILSDPDLLLRRRLKLLAGLPPADVVALIGFVAPMLQELTAPVSPWW